MASRTWVAVVLCCLVWYAYIRWFGPPPPSSTPQTPAASVEQPEASLRSASTFFPKRPESNPSIKIPNSVMDVVYSDLGGRVLSVTLKGYKTSIKKDAPQVETVSPGLTPFSLATVFTDKRLNEFSYGKYDQFDEAYAVKFTKEAGGVRAQKIYTLEKDSFFIDTEVRLTFPKTGPRDWGYLLIPVGASDVQYDANLPLQSWEAVYNQNDKVHRNIESDLPTEPLVSQGVLKWLSFGNRYFASVLVNESTLNPDLILVKEAQFSGGILRYPLLLKDGQSEVDLNLKIFSGPKDFAALAPVPSLKKLIDYGFFDIFAFPLLEVLRFLNKFVHNYGVAIILLTVLVRLVTYPLTLKSARSMKEMQKVQPQLNALREKYKDDAQRLGQEQLALYKAHKINPMGGCLPILAQTPVFIALYQVLASSMELYHAPFVGWIQDLSAKDPYYIFPALMGITMFIQQKMTPAAGMDPTQQKIMLIMPVMFTFFMINLPSGLTLYFFLSTLLGILQQMLVNREHSPGGAKLVTADGNSTGKS